MQFIVADASSVARYLIAGLNDVRSNASVKNVYLAVYQPFLKVRLKIILGFLFQMSVYKLFVHPNQNTRRSNLVYRRYRGYTNT